ncbi:glycerophosphodiester phosphodiesterase [Lactobacillus sp. PV012]|uniref:glycerophosphodiester phosphodiesterase n=1 Tax=Lactobacillus sp. PV012 TaxID=2594494 RepID=UPI00223ECDF5|nr:glycerophosphodiester phosphodiesterase [Lactobacillus sp. PV012]QNQ82827.1 glycerophosphodiester phosphodiesterase [Lactobacillus sp. PV012]
MKEVKLWTRKFFQNFWQYIGLLLSVSLFLELILIPFFRFLTTFILQAGKVPFISYQNIVILLTTHPLVCLLLLVELVAIIIVIYGEFSYLMIGIEEINKQGFRLRKTIFRTKGVLTKVKISSLVYLIIYFLLIVPFADLVYRTPLLAKIHLPQFIMDYMTRNGILFMLLVSSYLLILYLGFRSIFILPLMINKNLSAKEARKKSWEWTRRKNGLRIIKQLFLIEIFAGITTAIGYGAIIAFQTGVDLLPRNFSFGFAQVNLVLIQMIAFVGISYSFVVSSLMLLNKTDNEKKDSRKVSFQRNRKYFLGALLLVEAGLIFLNNSFYLREIKFEKPLIISHRGVSDKNGIQNTITALKKTSSLKPDYVEIDLHETADKKFVVLHDENLKKLAGKNLSPHDLTLRQLQKITITENGYQGKIASFDEYIKEAQKLHQKLLLEIKTTPKDSSGMLKRFNKKYGKLILSKNYQVQSLDYHVIEELHQLNPRLFLIYIQPYNFTYPHSLADGYAMEYSTLNNSFVWQAHLQKKVVYAWTVNNSKIMKKMMYYHVNGIITDDIEKTRQTIKKFNQANSYATQLTNYVLVFSS